MNSSCVRFVILGMAMVLAACSGQGEHADLKLKMEEIKRRPQGRIEPPPGERQTCHA